MHRKWLKKKIRSTSTLIDKLCLSPLIPKNQKVVRSYYLFGSPPPQSRRTVRYNDLYSCVLHLFLMST